MGELAIALSNNLKETWEDRFPDVMERYPKESIIKYQKSISARGQLLPVGSRGGSSWKR
jgi:hypothetical protein